MCIEKAILSALNSSINAISVFSEHNSSTASQTQTTSNVIFSQSCPTPQHQPQLPIITTTGTMKNLILVLTTITALATAAPTIPRTGPVDAIGQRDRLKPLDTNEKWGYIVPKTVTTPGKPDLPARDTGVEARRASRSAGDPRQPRRAQRPLLST